MGMSDWRRVDDFMRTGVWPGSAPDASSAGCAQAIYRHLREDAQCRCRRRWHGSGRVIRAGCGGCVVMVALPAPLSEVREVPLEVESRLTVELDLAGMHESCAGEYGA